MAYLNKFMWIHVLVCWWFVDTGMLSRKSLDVDLHVRDC